jgi:hypothetical protein
MGEARRKKLYEEELEREPLWYQVYEAFAYCWRRLSARWRQGSDDDWPDIWW